MKRIILILMFIYLSDVWATITFERFYGYSHFDQAYAVECTDDNGYIICGLFSATGGLYAGSMEIDSLGDPLWAEYYRPTNGIARAKDLVILPDQGHMIAGWCGGHSVPTTYDVYIARLSSSGGDTLWTKFYGGNQYDKAYSIDKTQDNCFIIAGETRSYGQAGDVWLLKINGDGDTLWTRTYGGSSYDVGRCIKKTHDGGFIIAGATYSSGEGYADMLLIKTDSIGNEEWSTTYGGTNYDWAYDVAIAPDSGYILVGYTNSFGAQGLDMCIVRTDQLGNVLWASQYGGRFDDLVHSITTTTDGHYVISGYTETQTAGYRDFYLVKMDTSGAILWNRTFGGIKDEEVWDVQEAQDKGFILVGYSCSSPLDPSCPDIFVVKTDSLGNTGCAEDMIVNQIKPATEYFALPNPFVTSAIIPGYEQKYFSIYDICGKRVSISRGDQIGRNLPAGVYFVKNVTENSPMIRIVKIK